MRLRAIPRLAMPLVTPLATVLLAGGLIAGCGDKKDMPATQTAAKVNKEELTVHQINAVLAQQRSVRPEQTEQAARRILERLIDQELAVQKAAELKLDRDPRVVQAIESVKREIVARAYAEKLAEGAQKPTAAEVKQYYDANPALFSERRVYQLHEFVVQASAAQAAALRDKLPGQKSPADVAQQLRAQDLKFASSQVVRAAEQVPLELLGELSKLKDGQLLVTPSPVGASVLFVLASRAQPIDEARAAPAIEQFLHNDRKRRLVAQDLKALRGAAKIEYVGKYADGQPVAEATVLPSVADAAASAAASLEVKQAGDGVVLKPRASAASEVEAADARVKAASGVDTSTISKGLGLK